MIRKEKGDKSIVENAEGDSYVVGKSNIILRNDNIVEFDDKHSESNWRFPENFPNGPDKDN